MTINATPVSNIPISVDYTSRDYYALREDLIKRISDRIPEWTGSDPSDFGVAMAEAFAYMGDIVNYYIDRVANENYLETATQRQSVLDLAATLGYVPTGYRASTIDVNLNNTSDENITLLTGTQFQIDVLCEDEVQQLMFTTTEDVTILANAAAVVSATNGEWAHSKPENLVDNDQDVAAEWVGTSNGLPDQVFQLSENQVVDGSVIVYVQNGDVYEQWTQFSHITDAGPNDPAYYVTIDGDNFVYINFGDGISGAIPNNLSTIKVDYLIGGGVLGNIPSGTIDEVFSSPGLTSSEVTVISSSLVITNTEGLGGGEPESNDNIRYAAPLFFSSQNRAVTLKDYANLALGVSQVGKTNAVAETPQAVTIFVGPDPDPADTFQYPGYDADPNTGGVVSPAWTDIKEFVLSYIADKVMIGTTVTVAPPAYPNVSITVQYTKLAQYSYDQVETNIKAALVNAYSYTNSTFGQIIYPEDVEALLRQVNGIASVQVKDLFRVSEPAGRNLLVASPNEIFVFNEADMEIMAAEALLNITASSGDLAPAFNASIGNYSVALPDGTTSVTVAPTAVTSTSTIRVNGDVVVSGADSLPIATPIGVTNANIVVTAQDGVTVKTYVVTFTRNA